MSDVTVFGDTITFISLLFNCFHCDSIDFLCCSYETGNGIRAQEDGFLKNRGSQLEAQVKNNNNHKSPKTMTFRYFIINSND